MSSNYDAEAKMFDDLGAAQEAIEEITPRIVSQYRTAGILTWALLHQIEIHVLDELAASGAHSKTTIQMIRSADVSGFPKDQRPVDFKGAEILPIVFSEIDKAWNLLH